MADSWGFGLDFDSLGGQKNCFECGVLTIGVHHPVPVVRGGTKILPLCPSCHAKAHGDNPAGGIYRPELIKDGLQRRRDAGLPLGCPVKLTGKVVEKAIQLHGEGLPMRTIARRLKISVGSVHAIISKERS